MHARQRLLAPQPRPRDRQRRVPGRSSACDQVELGLNISKLLNIPARLEELLQPLQQDIHEQRFIQELALELNTLNTRHDRGLLTLGYTPTSSENLPDGHAT